MPCLRYRSHKIGTKFFELEGKDVFVMGRSRLADLLVDYPMSSRRHCELRKQENGDYVLVDLDSKNGTAVNGDPIGKRTLQFGDVISIGAATIAFLEKH